MIVEGMTVTRRLWIPVHPLESTSRWWLGEIGWVMVVWSVSMMAVCLPRAPDQPASTSDQPGQQHRCTSSEDSNKNAGRSPLSSAESLAALLAPAQGAGFTGSEGLVAGELHQLLQLAPSLQTHN